MSSLEEPRQVGAGYDKFDGFKDLEKPDVDIVPRDISISIGESDDILAQQDIDPALNAKMHLVNNVRRDPSSFLGRTRVFSKC